MEGNVCPSQVRMEILSETLKEQYLEWFMFILTTMVYGEQDTNNELYTLYDELYTVKVIKIGRLKWLGHPFRMQELDPCRNLLS